MRLVQKHLIRTIEDTGVLTPAGEFYYNTNPGFGWSLPISQGGKFIDTFWACPKAKREYYGMNLSLEKRFSNNWQGGVNYTLSRTAGQLRRPVLAPTRTAGIRRTSSATTICGS